MSAPKKPPTKQPLTPSQSSPSLEDASRANFTQPAASILSTDGDTHNKIAEAAYHRAAQRGFEPGHELDDWLSAEAEVTGHALQRAPVSIDAIAVRQNELDKE
ncbi:MAG: DUF2934 domain-containing protein [Steroidobacteraceae bacterium]